jgi:hypothetical protein
MEQSPSWEANRFVASQEIPRSLWNRNVHHRSDKCQPPVSFLNPVHAPHPTFRRFILYQISCSFSIAWVTQKDQSRPEEIMAVSWQAFFYGEELVAPRQNYKMEYHPLSAVDDCFFSIFAASLHIRGCSSDRTPRTRHCVATEIHLSPYRQVMGSKKSFSHWSSEAPSPCVRRRRRTFSHSHLRTY